MGWAGDDSVLSLVGVAGPVPAQQVVAPGDADARLTVVGALAVAPAGGAVEGQQVFADGRIAAQVQEVAGGDAAL